MICSAKGCGKTASVSVTCSVKLEDGTEQKVALPLYFCETDREGVQISDTAVTDELRAGLEKALPAGKTLGENPTITFSLTDIVNVSAPKEIERVIQRLGNTFTMFDQIQGSHAMKAQGALHLADAAIDAARVIRNYPGEAGRAERLELADALTDLSSTARKAWKSISQKHSDAEVMAATLNNIREQGGICGPLIREVLSSTPSGN